MNFHTYHINQVQEARNKLLKQATMDTTSNEYLTLLQQAKELLKLENNLKTTNDQLEAVQNQLEAIAKEKITLAKILEELDELKKLTNATSSEIILKEQDTLSKIAKLLPEEKQLNKSVNNLECELKTLEKQASFLLETDESIKTVETTNVLVNKVSQILEKNVDSII